MTLSLLLPPQYLHQTGLEAFFIKMNHSDRIFDGVFFDYREDESLSSDYSESITSTSIPSNIELSEHPCNEYAGSTGKKGTSTDNIAERDIFRLSLLRTLVIVLSVLIVTVVSTLLVGFLRDANSKLAEESVSRKRR